MTQETTEAKTPKQRKPRKKTTTSNAETPAKKLTLNEFRAWLSGVEEMQPDNWAPDRTQWRRIRAKIDEIVVDSVSQRNNRAPMSEQFGGEPPRVVRPAGPSLLTPATVGPPHMAPATTPPPFMATRDMPAKGQGGVSPHIKTPDIDTSTGQGYVSGLE